MDISRCIDQLTHPSPEDKRGLRDLATATLATTALLAAFGWGLHAATETASHAIDEHFRSDDATSQPSDETQGGLVGIFDNLTDK